MTWQDSAELDFFIFREMKFLFHYYTTCEGWLHREGEKKIIPNQFFEPILSFLCIEWREQDFLRN